MTDPQITWFMWSVGFHASTFIFLFYTVMHRYKYRHMNWTSSCELSGSYFLVTVMVAPFWGAVLWGLMIRYQNLEECFAYSLECNVGEKCDSAGGMFF
jgi:hypothetical protein